MSERYNALPLSDLLNTSDLLTAENALKQIEAFLSESSTGRSAFCKEFSRSLVERMRPFSSWVMFNEAGYIIYRPQIAVPIYLWMHGLVAGTIRDTVVEMRKLVEHIESCFIKPSGSCLVEERAHYVLQVLQRKFPYFETVSRREPLRIFLFANSHKRHNSQCAMGSGPGQIFIFMYHMKDSNVSPEYVFLHELGHALQMALTDSLDVVPDAFLRFDEAVGGQLKQGSSEAAEVFADLFAIAVMRGTDLSSHDPFSFSEKFKRNIESLITGLVK